MSKRPWRLIASRRDDSYRVFSIRTDRAVSPRNGMEYEFHVLESAPWVNVIPVTDDQEVVMVRQYRHGIQDFTLEIPGGLVEEGDTPQEAACRELREETGYSAREMISLGFVHPNPAIQDNRCYTFLAQGASKVGAQAQDGAEDIEVVTYPLKEIPHLIRCGQITHSLVIVAFYRLFMEFYPKCV